MSLFHLHLPVWSPQNQPSDHYKDMNPYIVILLLRILQKLLVALCIDSRAPYHRRSGHSVIWLLSLLTLLRDSSSPWPCPMILSLVVEQTKLFLSQGGYTCSSSWTTLPPSGYLAFTSSASCSHVIATQWPSLIPKIGASPSFCHFDTLILLYFS